MIKNLTTQPSHLPHPPNVASCNKYLQKAVLTSSNVNTEEFVNMEVCLYFDADVPTRKADFVLDTNAYYTKSGRCLSSQSYWFEEMVFMHDDAYQDDETKGMLSTCPVTGTLMRMNENSNHWQMVDARVLEAYETWLAEKNLLGKETSDG